MVLLELLICLWDLFVHTVGLIPGCRSPSTKATSYHLERMTTMPAIKMAVLVAVVAARRREVNGRHGHRITIVEGATSILLSGVLD
jgi:hypothetical protein